MLSRRKLELSDLKITDLKVAVVMGGMRIEEPYEWPLVQIYTDEGIVGIGECRGGKSCYSTLGVKEAILSMKPRLIGEDPTDVRRLHDKLYNLERAYSGLAAHAMSAIDIALWDIAGKALGAPIYRLLGGKYRDKIKVYADFGGVAEGTHATHELLEPELFGEEAKKVKRMGYVALKFDVFLLEHFYRPNRSISISEMRRMVNYVAAVREAIGDDTDLIVDCHYNYNAREVIRFAKAIQEYNLLWLEDPVPPGNVDVMARVTAASPVPICTGENLYTREGFRELIEKQAADVVEPDAAKFGGITELKIVADMAELYYMNVGPHNTSSPVATLAAAHVSAAIPNFLVMEHHQYHTPWWEKIVKGKKPILENGYINVPDKPGLGIELNEEEIIKNLKPGETFFK